jgi:exopolyphosphatase/guanosine-5'-triphosphate,3'-diphosphate pyrophosphatase
MEAVEGVDRAAYDTVAAVDLGSNSFHMILARVGEHGSVHVVDRLREQVQLAAGLDDERSLSPEARGRAIACLERFGERLRGVPPGRVRAVGTNTLRSMRDPAGFLRAAQRALGHPIDVIEGQEEARLIYLGVAHTQADDRGRRLVIDIGGGSTEFIIGERFEARYRESLYMGCVTASRRHFPEGLVTDAAMARAEIAARVELEAIERQYRRVGWEDCIGASGTIKAVRSVVTANGWSDGTITPKGLDKVRKALIRAGSADAIASLPGLSRERVAVFPGGLAILGAAFQSLGIEAMEVSDGALREGLLYDMLGRSDHEDVRERTILAMARRYQVAQRFAQRVAQTVEACRQQVAVAWGLEGEHHRALLRWAALLHEVGLAISHHSYHKHGAYLVRYSDMLGFSRQEQVLLSTLIRVHRRRFPKDALEELPEGVAGPAARMCVLLRLAVLLNHGRSPEPLPAVRVVGREDALELAFPPNWLARHPLTRANLEQEADYLKVVRLRLAFG